MNAIITKIKKNPYLFSMIFILVIGLFFRTYQILDRYIYAHDADLFSWIVKDILVNHHLRLIGQLTSADGIYIGPLFYYALIPFFLLTKMDPAGGTILITVLGMLYLISLYLVFTKLFNKVVGLIMTFLGAILIPSIDYDRWVVPSTPSNLWSVWYFYTLINITRGNYKILPLLAILIGLIWDIHIALAPTLLGIPIAIFIAKKWPTIKQTAIFLTVLLISNLPLILFEVKHNFSQTHALLANLKINHGGAVGLPKVLEITSKITSNLDSLLFTPQSIQPFGIILFLLILLLPIFLIWKKVLKLRDYLPLLAWIIGVYLFFSFSSTLISEYYFYSIQFVFLVFISLFLYYLSTRGRKWQIALLIFFGLLLIKNLYFYTTEHIYQKGYLARKSVAEYITEDSRTKGYPCVSINYITAQGENVGFRYFFYLDNLKTHSPNVGTPVYSIVLPKEYSLNELTYSYGEVGTIAPKEIPPKDVMEKACSANNSNLTNPVLGFTQ